MDIKDIKMNIAQYLDNGSINNYLYYCEDMQGCDQNNKGQYLYRKIGKVTGGGAALLLYPDENLIISYTCNLTASRDNTPIFTIAEHFLSSDEEPKE